MYKSFVSLTAPVFKTTPPPLLFLLLFIFQNFILNFYVSTVGGTWSSQKKKKREFQKYSVKYSWALLGKKLHMHTQPLSCVRLFSTPWTVAPPGSSGSPRLSFQARILGLVAISSLRESSRPRDRIYVSCLAGEFFTFFTTVPPEKPILVSKSFCKTSSLCK